MRRTEATRIIEHVSRSGLEQNQDIHAFGPFRLDVRRRRLSRDATPLTLTPTVLEVLIHLVCNAGRVVTKDELLDAAWPGRVVEEANVKQAVFTLRKALGTHGDGIIATVPGRGYRFTADVQLAPQAASAPPSAPAPAASARPGRVLWWAGAVLGLAGTALLAAFFLRGRAPAPAIAGRTVSLPISTIARATQCSTARSPTFCASISASRRSSTSFRSGRRSRP
jgi:DNA-binding winged helix-turn-helix (wHTH) protein